MTDREIYRCVLRFVWPRPLYLLAGFAAYLMILWLGIRLAGAFPAVAAPISAAAVTGGLIVFLFLKGFRAKADRAALVAVTAEAVTAGALPGDPVAFGRAAVARRYPCRSVFSLLCMTARLPGMLFSRRVSRQEKAAARKAWRRAAVAVLVLQVSGHIPFVGDCTAALDHTRPERPLRRNIRDGAAAFFRHFPAMLRQIGRGWLFGFAVLLPTGLVLFAALLLVNVYHPALVDLLGSLAADRYTAVAETVSVAAAVSLLVTVLVLAQMNVFVRAYTRIRVIRRYLTVAGEAK